MRQRTFKLSEFSKWIGKKLSGLNSTIINDTRLNAYPNIHTFRYSFKYAETMLIYNGCLLICTIVTFLFFYSLQLGPSSSIIKAHFNLMINTKILNFLYENICLWVLPFLFLLLWLAFFLFVYLVCLRRIATFRNKRTTSIRDANSMVSIIFGHILIIQIPLVILLFIILLLHERNSSMNYIIQVPFINIFNNAGSSLFLYFTSGTPILIMLILLLLVSYLYQVKTTFMHKNLFYLFNLSITYIAFLFLTILIFYCNNFLLLIFLLDCILLLLLNLIRLQNYKFIIINFFKSVFIFITVQSISTLIYCYGLSIMYIQNQFLSFDIINDITTNFAPFHLEFSSFIFKGVNLIILSLFLKIGLGPLGFWILNIVKIFNYPFLIFYFSYIKPLYFIIIVKIIVLFYSNSYNQQFLYNYSNFKNTDYIKFDHFKFIIEKQLNITDKFSDESLSLIITQTQYLLQDIKTCILIFSIFSVIIGTFGILYTNNIKKFIAYSSMLNYGLIILPIFSTNMLSIHYSVIFVFIYSLTNVLFIGLFSYLTHFKNISLTSKNYFYTNSVASFIFILCILSFAGLPPTFGFFSKISILIEIFKFEGFYIGFFFIFFTFLSSFGYIRFLKNSLNINTTFITWNKYILNYYLLPVVYRYFIFFFILSIFSILFLWVYIFLSMSYSNISIFNAFAFYNTNFFAGSLIPQITVNSQIKVDLVTNMESLIKTSDPYFKNFLAFQLEQYSQLHYLLTGTYPSADQIALYKTYILEFAEKKLQFYHQGDGLEYIKKHEICLSLCNKHK